MKVISIAAAGVSLALIASTLLPAVGDDRPYFAVGALVCAAIVLLTIVVGWRDRPSAVAAGPSAVTSTPPGAPQTTAPAPTATSSISVAPPLLAPAPAPTGASSVSVAPLSLAPAGAAEVVSFLATLQEKGRLVDFLQDDITSYSDAQVGAAARIVHQGCKAVLGEYVRIVPVRPENEGAKITIDAGYAADEYRLVGKISGQAPFSGILMHRGWKADSVTLPRVLRTDDDRFPTIAPAEVELK